MYSHTHVSAYNLIFFEADGDMFCSIQSSLDVKIDRLHQRTIDGDTDNARYLCNNNSGCLSVVSTFPTNHRYC